MTGKPRNPDDPRALIWDAYRIEGIGPGECRSIYLDWALGMPADSDLRAASARLLAIYGPAAPDHPMTAILRAAAERPPAGPRRRGGRRRRG
ncbi:MAG: hypothetical protein KatS3mg118_2744 [Paracoccaceae bacterium]|nr:MAG: hypothetical protein KatS3mg118_2744 [Paracoccaceae bacterium]